MRLAQVTTPNVSRLTPPAARRRAAQVSQVPGASGVPDLPSLVTHYQGVLRLRDWELDVRYVSDLKDSRGNPVWGLCYPCVDAKSATIYIRDPKTPPEGETHETASAQVVETVVHELVHLHFAPFGLMSSAEVAAEEQAVWALAPAIVRARGTADETHIARAMLALAPHRKSSPARSTTEKRMALDPKQQREALKLLIAKDQKNALAFIERLVVGEEDGEGPGGDSGGGDAGGAPPPAQMVPTEDQPKARAADAAGLEALARTALALTGKATANEAMIELARLASGGAPAAPAAALSAPAADPVAVERKALVARLVKINVETPATAWSDSTAAVPCARLVAEPLPELRSRVELLEKSITPRASITPPKSPTGGTGAGMARKITTSFGEVELTDREVRAAKARRTDPAELERFLAEYAENKAGNEHARGVRKGG